MSVDYQMEVPASFKLLYTDAALQSRYAPHNLVASRYTLCEDMAVMLRGIAQHMLASMCITKVDVLAHCHRSLNKRESAVTERESGWVICRLAELLDDQRAHLN